MSKATGCCFCGHNRRQERSDYCASCEHKLWTDDTLLTLDVLRRELREPNRVGEIQSDGSPDYLWILGSPMLDKWVEWSFDTCWFKGFGRVRTLGQLQRILSVIREQEADHE